MLLHDAPMFFVTESDRFKGVLDNYAFNQTEQRSNAAIPRTDGMFDLIAGIRV